MKRSLVDKLRPGRRTEGSRQAIEDGTQLNAEDSEVRRVAGHAYVVLAGEWDLSTADAAALLNVSEKDYLNWTEGNYTFLGAEHLEKISCLMGVFKYLATLYSGHFDRMQSWLKRKNSGELYGGKSPYELLVGADTGTYRTVRRDLAAQTQGL